MKLLNLENAIVPPEKITDYLLSAAHRDGRHKAAFFQAFGFAVERWEELAAVLLLHAEQHEVVKQEASPFGMRYVIEGTMTTPAGRLPMLRSVWFIESGGTIPQFVTAYPLPGARDD